MPFRAFEEPYYILDTETTHREAELARVVELAFLLVRPGGELHPRIFHTLVNPGIPIPPESSAIHHITDRDVANAPTWDEVLNHVTPFLQKRVVVAHNAEYDSSFFPKEANLRWLCSYRLALHLWPDAPEFKNQTLRYWLKEYDIDMRGHNPHRATGDILVSDRIVRHEFRDIQHRIERADLPRSIHNLDDVITFSEKPRLLTRMPTGKHRGDKFGTIDTGYMKWALNGGMERMSRDLRFTMEYHMNIRNPEMSLFQQQQPA